MVRQPGEPMLNTPAKMTWSYVATFVVMVVIVLVFTDGESARSRGLTCLAIGVILLGAAIYNVRKLSRGHASR